MRYRSTRGDSDRPPFGTILLEGLAPDGGLFVPESWPRLAVASSYPATVAAVLAPFMEPDPLGQDLAGLAEIAYADFRHPEVAPLREMGNGHFLLELFWGPTLAFKDHALQMLGLLFDRVLDRQERTVTVLGATSGDTGSAAIAACSGRPNLEVVILFPDGRVTDFQRRQMTTVRDPHVRAVAVEGNFDDCQDLVKQAFSDPALDRDLVAVNSINFARVAAQAAYYLWASAKFEDAVDFSVPTGNFGNVFAGLVAKRGGGKIDRLIAANNENHGLADLVTTGVLRVENVSATMSPSMDIAIPSNLERYLYDLAGRDSELVRQWQSDLRREGEISLNDAQLRSLQNDFDAAWIDDSQTMTTMKQAFEESGMMIDPHTAVGWNAGITHRRPGVPMVTLATADPVKFAPAVRAATGAEPPVPAGFEQLASLPERMIRIPNEYESLASLLTE